MTESHYLDFVAAGTLFSAAFARSVIADTLGTFTSIDLLEKRHRIES